jgi:hypothetical protein
VAARCLARVAAARSVEDIGLSPFGGRPRRRRVGIGFLAAIVISYFRCHRHFFYIASIKNDNSMSAITQNPDGHRQVRHSWMSQQTGAAGDLMDKPLFKMMRKQTSAAAI